MLESDQHWENAIADATISSPPNAIRNLFAIILTTCSPANPMNLWNKYRDDMSEDILNRVRINQQNPVVGFTPEIHNEALILIEDMCLMISHLALAQLGITAPNRAIHDMFNYDLQRESAYDIIDLSTYVAENVPKMLHEQKTAYDNIMHSINHETGTLFFMDAPGGTGKTFLISLILATVRKDQKIALALASSGIAATLLDGGRTAHSALKLPLNLHTTDFTVCRISKTSSMGKLLQQCKLIVWDECTMAHKKSLEALNRTLQDLRQNDRLFGGVVILLSGDFRQTLPAIQRGTPADELNACLKTSILWRNIEKLKLRTNMRVRLQGDVLGELFAQQLLNIGNGSIAANIDGTITLPEDFCNLVDSKEELIQKVFPDIANNYLNMQWISERAILAAKNKDVHDINYDIQNRLPGEIKIYLSTDTVTDPEQIVHYPTEFLNSLEIPGMPPHN